MHSARLYRQLLGILTLLLLVGGLFVAHMECVTTSAHTMAPAATYEIADLDDMDLLVVIPVSLQQLSPTAPLVVMPATAVASSRTIRFSVFQPPKTA